MDSHSSHGFIDRMIGASRLDVHIFEEVEEDKSAISQALSVVILSSLASAIASIGTYGLSGLLGVFGVSILGWALWAWIMYFIGTKILPTNETHADWGQLARTLGFAQSPGILSILGILPLIGWAVSLVVLVWTLMAMVIAVRQALDYNSTGRAIGVVLLGFIPYAISMVTIISLLFPAPMTAG